VELNLDNENFEGEYVVMIAGEKLYFHNTNQIPDRFDHLIRFAPFYPPAPHDLASHERIHRMSAKLQELMEIERRAGRNENR
jgi:hypothetical protein